MLLVCPTALKGTLSAAEAADALAAGARDAAPDHDIVRLPLSDGGNGLLDALVHGGQTDDGATLPRVTVAGPLGDAVSARYLLRRDLTAVETAEACGLHLVDPARRDPLRAGTRGVGQLLLAAASGSLPLVVGLGGSATIDAGAGMAAALGWRLLDERGRPLAAGGGALTGLASIRPPPAAPLPAPPVVLADVTNPLLGASGAAAVYGPQKGASARQVATLERGLERWARIVERDLGRDVAGVPGAGAAGGLGAAFAAFLDAPPVPGAGWVLDAVGFQVLLERATAVITAEGAWDAQSCMGKVTGEVVGRARRAGVPVLVVAGSIQGELPAGAVGAAGRGEVLDAAALAALARGGMAGLLGRRGDP